MRREFSSADELILAAEQCILDSRRHLQLFRQSLKSFQETLERRPPSRGGERIALPIAANTPDKASLLVDMLFMELVLNQRKWK
jgi:hypothetical protein